MNQLKTPKPQKISPIPKIQKTLSYFQKFQNIDLPFAFTISAKNENDALENSAKNPGKDSEKSLGNLGVSSKNTEAKKLISQKSLENSMKNSSQIENQKFGQTTMENLDNWDELDNPHVVFVGALHGNEPAGLDAIIAFHEHFLQNNYKLQKGKITFILGSPDSFKISERFLDQNLNRAFTKVISKNREALRVAQIRQFLTGNSVDILLDFHSVSTGDFKMAIFQTQKARDFAQKISPLDLYFLPHTEHLPGSLMEECQNVGTTALSFECGNHSSPLAPEIALIHLQNTLLELKMITKNQLIPTNYSQENSQLNLENLTKELSKSLTENSPSLENKFEIQKFNSQKQKENVNSQHQNSHQKSQFNLRTEKLQMENLETEIREKSTKITSNVSQSTENNSQEITKITSNLTKLKVNHSLELENTEEESIELGNKLEKTKNLLEISEKSAENSKASVTFYETLSIIKPQKNFKFVDKSATTGTLILKGEIFATFKNGNYKAFEDCFLMMPDHFPKITDFDAGFLCRKSIL